MRFVAGRGRRGEGAVGRGAMAELLLAGALQRSAIGKRLLAGEEPSTGMALAGRSAHAQPEDNRQRVAGRG